MRAFLKSAKGPVAGLHTEEELRITRRRGSVLRAFLKSAKGPAAGLHTEEELRITRRRGSVLRAFLKSGPTVSPLSIC